MWRTGPLAAGTSRCNSHRTQSTLSACCVSPSCCAICAHWVALCFLHNNRSGLCTVDRIRRTPDMARMGIGAEQWCDVHPRGWSYIHLLLVHSDLVDVVLHFSSFVRTKQGESPSHTSRGEETNMRSSRLFSRFRSVFNGKNKTQFAKRLLVLCNRSCAAPSWLPGSHERRLVRRRASQGKNS